MRIRQLSWMGGVGAALALVLGSLCVARAAPGDALVVTDFRVHNWTIHAPKGTASPKGLELDYAQNAIKLKDGGAHEWYFQSPVGFFSGDKALAYNGTIQVHLQSLEWSSAYVEGYDIVLVSSLKRHTIGIKGVKKDGETSKLYNVTVNEDTAWEHIYPALRKEGGKMRTEVSKDDLISALTTMTNLRVRGGYYTGVEKTQLRSVKILQGVMAGDESTTGDGECCGGRQRTCVSDMRYDLVFNNPGQACSVFNTVSAGTIAVGDSATVNAQKVVRLETAISSPDYDYYIGKKMTITAGTGTSATAFSEGFITNYLGELDWAVHKGVSAVEIVRAGSGCASGGVLEALSSNGTGFSATFDVLFTIPAVTVTAGGLGCAGTADTVTATAVSATGGVTALTLGGETGTKYITGRAVIICEDPCTGSGLEVTCTAVAGDVTAGNIDVAGSGYTLANPPIIKCAEGSIEAFDSCYDSTTANCGSGFAAVFSTAAATGAIDYVLVTNPGSGYVGATTLVPNVLASTCINFVLTTQPSGYITKVTIQSNGDGYAQDPAFTISSGGVGCTGFTLLGKVGDMTGDTLPSLPTASLIYLASSGSSIDSYYNGMSIAFTSGANAGVMRNILSYSADGRTVTVETAFAQASAIGDGYAITKTPVRVITDAAQAPALDHLPLVYGDTTEDMGCSCDAFANEFTTGALCRAELACAAARCECRVKLAATASVEDDFLTGETITFTEGAAAGQSARVTAYEGATNYATIAVAPDSEHAFRVASTIAVVSGTSYISSASHVAKVALALDGVTSTAVTDTTSTYTIAYEDFSVAERAHARSQRFFCDQAVGKPPAPVGDPSSEWITMPFVKTFAFRAVPLVCSVATLKIEAQTESDDDLLYAGRNLTVVGENSEILGYMFHDSAAFVGLNEGFQLHDTITFSAEKMMEMSADGEVVFTLRTDPTVTGGLKFRMMTLSFSPTACFSSVAATDEYVEINDRDPTIKSIYYNLTIYTPPTLMGAPASDAIVTVTADADLADGYLELSYGTEKVNMFRDWVWGEGTTSYQLSEPISVGEVCTGTGTYPDFSCTRGLSAVHNNTRSGRHTAHHRIPRKTLYDITSKSATGSFPLSFKVFNTNSAKLSPIKLNYALMGCKLQTLTVADGQIFGAPLYRPSYNHFSFPGDSPPAAAAATLWVSAYIQNHKLHVADSLGAAPQSVRVLNVDSGDPYSVTLDTARDPLREEKLAQKRWPHLGALKLFAGDRWQEIDFVFHDDFSQYDSSKPFVASVNIPLSIMVQFSRERKVHFTIEVPPGDGVVIVHSAVIAYPTTEA